MDWYYASNGQQAGPVSQEQLAELFRNGTVKPFDLVWNETMTEWTPIGKLSEFAAAAPAPAPAAPPLDTPPPMSSPAAPPLAASPAAPAAAAPSLAPAGMTEPSTYLWQSIVIMVLCCLPLGIPALIFATKVKPAFAAGDYVGAQEASKKAKMFCIIGLIVGFIVQAIYITINIIAVVSTSSQSYQ